MSEEENKIFFIKSVNFLPSCFFFCFFSMISIYNVYLCSIFVKQSLRLIGEDHPFSSSQSIPCLLSTWLGQIVAEHKTVKFVNWVKFPWLQSELKRFGKNSQVWYKNNEKLFKIPQWVENINKQMEYVLKFDDYICTLHCARNLTILAHSMACVI